MSRTKKLFYLFRNLRTFFRNKVLHNYFVFALTIFLFLGVVFNAYVVADESAGYNVVETYKTVDELSTASTGNIEGKHSHKSQGFQTVDFLGNLLDLVNPQANANYALILENENIPLSAKLGLMGVVDTSATALLYNPPYIDVTEHLAQQWVPNYEESSQSVYAVSGYDQLQSLGLDGIWSITRNIAYMLFVIVFIVAGFMIMFRHKLGGQTMVTVYNTLPSIIVGLVLVTFSFAIVGLIIDLGVFLQNVIQALLNLDKYMNPVNPGSIYWRFWGDGFWIDVRNGDLDMSFKGVFLRGLEGFFTSLPGARLGSAGANIFTGNSPQDLMLLTIASVVVLFAAVKVFIALLKAYLGIIFDTIIGPLVLAAATIPGKKGLMQDWFNRLFKNVLVFVLVFLIVHIPVYILTHLDINAWDLFSTGLGKPRSAIADDMGDIFGTSKFLYAAIAIYCFFLAANVPKMLEDYFPQTGGKGSAEAAKGVSANLQKIPGLGGFFK